MGYIYRNNALSFRFVDEEYNFAIGKYLLRGETLYDDIITNHQPITHSLSSFVQELSQPNSTFLLIMRHREFIIFWSTLWSVFFVYYFGLSALLFIIIFELTKNRLLGNLFLAETIVVYPLLFLIGLVVYNKSNFNRLEIFFLATSFSFATLTLGPIWPALGLLIFLLLYKLYKQKHFITNLLILLISGLSIFVFLIWKQVSLFGYFYYYLYTNLAYTVPNYHGTDESWFFTFLKAFISPILSFTRPGLTPTTQVINILSLLLIVNLLFFVKTKKYSLAFIIVTLLGLSNIRFIFPGTEGYSGFHLLPWYASLIFISSAIAIQNLRQNYFILRIVNVMLIIIAISLSIKYSQQLINRKDVVKDYLINYSTHTDRGEIIKIMKHPEDTLFVSSDAWLIYWQSDIDHLPNLFGYYAWMSSVPSLHSAILKSFMENPPTFFYCDNCKGLDLERFLPQYLEIKKDNGETNLYVLRSKIQDLTLSQLKKLKFYNAGFD